MSACCLPPARMREMPLTLLSASNLSFPESSSVGSENSNVLVVIVFSVPAVSFLFPSSSFSYLADVVSTLGLDSLSLIICSKYSFR